MGDFWSTRCLLQDSASLSILVALRLNISVKFCQGNQAIVPTWLLHMRPRLYLTWIAVQFWSAALLLSTTLAHLVTVKRTGIEHPHFRQKIWVVLLLLFCWSLSEYRPWKAAGSSVFCLSVLFLWFALPRLCGPWTCFMGWQQWLLHNQGSGNNPPVLKSSIKPEMESFSDGTVCVSLCGWWTESSESTFKQRRRGKSPHLQTLAGAVLTSDDWLLPSLRLIWKPVAPCWHKQILTFAF